MEIFSYYTTLIYSPLNQFEIANLISIRIPALGNLVIGLFNISFYLSLAIVLILFFNILTNNYNKIINST